MTAATTSESLQVLTFNLNNPSRERAERQLAWLSQRPEHLLVLTETLPSKGCAFLAQSFRDAGFDVHFPQPDAGERGVMIVSRLPLTERQTCTADYLPFRAASVSIDTSGGSLDVVGLYVPSRDATPAKTERKRRFLDACRAGLPAGQGPHPRIVTGDFNILEPHHQPRYRFFRPFEYEFYTWLIRAGYRDAFRLLHPTTNEYSWTGRTGDGYRYDHAFVSTDLAALVAECGYVHEPRTTRLTDHSALALQLSVAAPEPLLVSDPTTRPESAVLF